MAAYLASSRGVLADRVTAINAQIPTLQTDRLSLRPCLISDWAILAPIWTTQRSQFIGGPFSDEDAWLDFNQCVAGWLLRGFGPLTICERRTGDVLGLAIWGHERTDPEAELGWLLTEAAEGHGYATEAATALLDHIRQTTNSTPVSYVDAANTRSVQLAERLGGVADAKGHPMDDDVRVFRFGGAA